MRFLFCRSKNLSIIYFVLAIAVLFSFFVGSSVFAQESSEFKNPGETITITTYYPAPFGVYRALRLAPSGPVDEPKEGEMYYDEQEHALKLYTGGKWSGIVWFGNAGIFLKDGASVLAPHSVDDGQTIFRGQAKYEEGKIYTRLRILDKSESIVCDSEWKQGLGAECSGNGYRVDAQTNAAGVTLRAYKKVVFKGFRGAAKVKEYHFTFKGEWQ